MTWIIYKHTNIANGKTYIGQTRRSLNDRWRNGKGYSNNTRFSHAINKYGWDGFTHEIVEENITTQQLANEREIYWINYYNSYDFDSGYNMSPGGYLQSAESHQKAVDSLKKNHRNKINFIVCYELCKIFINPTIALEWFLSNGYEIEGKKNPIVRVIDKEEHTCFGYHFCSIINLLSFKPKSSEDSNSTKGARRKVICIDTGDIFESLTECGRILNIKSQHLSCACKNHTKTHNMYFSYLEEYDETWQKYIKNRVGTNQKAIYCIELDKKWDSYSLCAKELGFSSSILTTLIKSQDPLKIHRTIKGYHFCKPDEVAIYKIVDKAIVRSDSRKVYCIETKEVFDSVSLAERNKGCKNILKCCNDWKYTSKGLHWCFYDDIERYSPVEQKERTFRNGLAKSVIRIDDGKVFPSASAAAKSVNRDVTSLIGAINKGTKCAGYRWNYLVETSEID